MTPPPGIGLNGKVLHLTKALYGLKQAPLQWYNKLTSVLALKDLKPAHFDPCVFINKECNLILAVYVDDITVVGSPKSLAMLTAHLKTHFEVTTKGRLSYILGIEISHTPDAIWLGQHQYITQICERFGMDNSRTVSTPLDPKCSLQSAPEEEEAFEQNLYQQMIGSLMYLVTCTRPDLAHVVSFLSTFSARPLSCHHTAVKRVFRYIWTTRSLSLKYPKPS